MSKLYFFLSMLLLIAIAVFVAINPSPATVNFFWSAEIKTTVAILILCSVAIGAVFIALVDLARQIKVWRELRQLKAKLKTAEEELKLLRAKSSTDSKPSEQNRI